MSRFFHGRGSENSAARNRLLDLFGGNPRLAVLGGFESPGVVQQNSPCVATLQSDAPLRSLGLVKKRPASKLLLPSDDTVCRSTEEERSLQRKRKAELEDPDANELDYVIRRRVSPAMRAKYLQHYNEFLAALPRRHPLLKVAKGLG